MPIAHAVPLAPRTTLELGGPARHLAIIDREADALEALRWAGAAGVKVAVLGGGSNVVVSDAGFDGLVLVMAQRGLEFTPQPDGSTRVDACAGEVWDELVAQCVARGLSGLECLSGIPGLAGATPIQNVGAYGQEVADVIAAVTVIERDGLRVRTLAKEACGFGYRDSAFKRAPERHVVLKVSFVLRPGPMDEARYAELRAALAARGARPGPGEVREAVLALRRGKSMVLDGGDENRRSVGSFFTNPVLSAQAADRVVERALAAGWVASAEEVPRYPQADGQVKLAAAWLLERAGVRKGEREGNIGVSSRHALALVHHGGGTTAELVGYARRVRDRVRDALDVELTPEPVFLGFPAGFRL